MLQVTLLIALNSNEVVSLIKLCQMGHELNSVCGILRGIFVAWKYMAVTCEGDIAVGCVLAHILKNVGSIFPCSIRAVWVKFVM